jgi:hypothetical protein
MGAARLSTAIEDLIADCPDFTRFMVEKGLPCAVCREPNWGTSEDVARQSGKTDREMDLLVNEVTASLEAGGR